MFDAYKLAQCTLPPTPIPPATVEHRCLDVDSLTFDMAIVFAVVLSTLTTLSNRVTPGEFVER